MERKEVTTAHCSHDSAREVNPLFACEFRRHCKYSVRVTDRTSTDGVGMGIFVSVNFLGSAVAPGLFARSLLADYAFRLAQRVLP
jgi:hypothetical protein